MTPHVVHSLRALRNPARPLVAAAALLSSAACKDSSSAPPDPLGIRTVLVGVQVDSAALRDRGEFTLRLVPVDGRGQVVLTDGLTVTPSVTAPTAQPLPPVAQRLQLPDTRPVAAAIVLDDSKSMGDNDPTGQRTAAARAFWQELLVARPTHQVALLSFGGDRATAPFARTNLLESWTSDTTRLASALGRLAPAGSTYLYESTAEVTPWVNSSRPVAAYRRVMLVVTDGLPTDSGSAALAIQSAAAAQIPIYTVGIGPASSESAASNQTAVERLRELANETGGVYAGVENNAALKTTFRSLAQLATEGALLVTVRMSPAPAAGTTVRGTVRVANSISGASANWSFAAP
jgi:Mg-chelatase subunit ChlD